MLVLLKKNKRIVHASRRCSSNSGVALKPCASSGARNLLPDGTVCCLCVESSCVPAMSVGVRWGGGGEKRAWCKCMVLIKTESLVIEVRVSYSIAG